jgi:hypothetical protein
VRGVAAVLQEPAEAQAHGITLIIRSNLAKDEKYTLLNMPFPLKIC